jgi:hydrogenase maturation protease
MRRSGGELVGAVVIGYGNTLRGDDGAGPAVAEAVAGWSWPGVRAHAVHQLLPEMVEWLAGARMAVFVDAAAESSSGPVQVCPLHPSAAGAPLGHTGDPGWLLALAGWLYGAVPPAWLVTVPAANLSHGEGLSEACWRGVAEALRQVAELLGEPGELPCTK